MRLLHLSLMAFVSLGLTGCIKISGEDSFKADGSFVSEADFDFSALQEMTEGLKELDDESTEVSSKNDLEDFCKTTKEESTNGKRYRTENFECKEVEKGKFHVKITGQTKDNYLSIKNGVYTLTMDNKDLEIGGGGSQLEYLQNLSKELHVSDSVVFHGWMDNSKVPEFLIYSLLLYLVHFLFP